MYFDATFVQSISTLWYYYVYFSKISEYCNLALNTTWTNLLVCFLSDHLTAVVMSQHSQISGSCCLQVYY